MVRSIILSLLLSSTALAANPLFGAYSTDQCDKCMDQTYESCPGDYQTRSYATCMCAGDGSANFVSCLSYCDPTLNEPANASATYYGYCLMFFKELCDGARQFVDDETYAKQCSKEAIKAGGIGEKGNGGDGGDSEKESDSNGDDDDSDDSTGIVVPTKTNESSSEKTNETGESNETDAATTTGEASKSSETAQTTSGAKATAIPAVALFAGLGLQLINV
ncbi:hypothetical protein FPOAC2_00244 [Fusarium poae]